MSSLATSRELHEGFNFAVSVDTGFSWGGEVARFSKLSSLDLNTTVTTYREGGSTLPIKDPDAVEFPPITLETGASQHLFFYTWAANIALSVNGTTDGLPIAIDKRNLTVYQFNRKKQVVKKIHIFHAFPTQFVAGEWDNAEDRVVIERLTLAYDYYTIQSLIVDQAQGLTPA